MTTNQTDSPVVRAWLGRAAALAGATLLMSLSAGPGAHADDGLLGDVTEVAGAVTQPVAEPVAQTVQSAVPQPVQQVVEPAVSQVMQPVVSHAEQTVEATVKSTEQTVEAAVKDAEQAVQPVSEVIKPEVRRAEEPVEQPQAQPQTADRVVRSAPAPAASQEAVTGDATSSHVDDESGHKGAKPVSAATREPGNKRRSSAATLREHVTDQAPRGTTGTVAPQQSDEREDLSAEALWNLTNALMHMWAGDNTPGSVDAGVPGDGTGARAQGTSSMGGRLLGLLMVCLSLAVGRRLLA
ncbi:hypothetical protein ACFQW6_19805 [Nocardioides sp. GCM10028917]|uniref:hypothetical protein n=1 Tax=Nocardioides sp. GCM10028917 TaxID=3273408 RepID=UPI0036164A0A